MTDTDPLPRGRTISGSMVVLAMFVFAMCGVAVLQIYWNRHLEPFMELQTALAERFDDEKGKSSPRVDGGQRKMSKNTPRILRVVMRIPFDPEDDENGAAIRERIHAVADVAVKHVKLHQDYDILTTHFYMEIPGGTVRQETFETPVEELATGADGSVSP